VDVVGESALLGGIVASKALDRITDRAHIIETGTESYRYRRTVEGREQKKASYRGPGAPANGPRDHYMFELFALDTKLDVQPGTDAFETRTNVMKAIQGHLLGKAAYVGLFRRPQ
jgi:phosphatidylethanolamine-binding protein (PEBP) family uncharacterized protein